MSGARQLTRRPLIAAAVLPVLLLIGFFVFAPEKTSSRIARDTAETPPRAAQEEPQAPSPAPAPKATTVLAAAQPGIDAPPKSELAIVGPRADDPHEPHMHPHPFTEEHKRIFAENALIQSLNDAMANRDTKRMRELLVEYRTLDPTDAHRGQRGYEVIADCIDSPGEVSLDAARRFYATERHSPLRRFVRRICFENGN